MPRSGFNTRAIAATGTSIALLPLALGLLLAPAAVAIATPVPLADSVRRQRGAPPSLVCPRAMSMISDFCIDSFEASTEELLASGSSRPHSPFEPVNGLRVRAVSRRGVVPQAYINRDEAEAACREAGKRLCTDDEWLQACQGREKTRYPYGDQRKPGYCVDTSRVAPLAVVFAGKGDDAYRFEPMNDPRLNQVPGTLAVTGSFRRCTNAFHVYDMVGNVHEWTADPAGTFRGGYYLDTKINGEGCLYRTVAHGPTYHDYSTGFRCCADLGKPRTAAPPASARTPPATSAP